MAIKSYPPGASPYAIGIESALDEIYKAYPYLARIREYTLQQALSREEPIDQLLKYLQHLESLEAKRQQFEESMGFKRAKFASDRELAWERINLQKKRLSLMKDRYASSGNTRMLNMVNSILRAQDQVRKLLTPQKPEEEYSIDFDKLSFLTNMWLDRINRGEDPRNFVYDLDKYSAPEPYVEQRRGFLGLTTPIAYNTWFEVIDPATGRKTIFPFSSPDEREQAYQQALASAGYDEDRVKLKIYFNDREKQRLNEILQRLKIMSALPYIVGMSGGKGAGGGIIGATGQAEAINQLFGTSVSIPSSQSIWQKYKEEAKRIMHDPSLSKEERIKKLTQYLTQLSKAYGISIKDIQAMWGL